MASSVSYDCDVCSCLYLRLNIQILSFQHVCYSRNSTSACEPEPKRDDDACFITLYKVFLENETH